MITVPHPSAAIPGVLKLHNYLQSNLGGRWHWIHSFKSREKHVPLLSLALCGVLVTCFLTYPGGWKNQSQESRELFTYESSPNLPWQTTLLAFASHVHANHLVVSSVNVFLAGVLLEMTEGSLRLFCIAWAAQTLSMGLHGAMDDRPVIGASGVGYGFMWAQLSLLALNWRELAFPFTRLTCMIGLASFNICATALIDGMKDTTAIWAHVGGSLAAASVAMIIGVNMRRQKWDWIPNCLGLLVYACLVVWVLACEQKKAGLLAAALLVILIPWAMYDLRPVSDAVPYEQPMPWPPMPPAVMVVPPEQSAAMAVHP